MPTGFPPQPTFPLAIDSDRTLFVVYNTSEAKTTKESSAWEEEIEIEPVSAGKEEIWADNGFANISGELFYYDAVEKNTNGKVFKFKRCARNIGGKQTRFNPAGTWVRGFVIAEHHNQLVDTALAIEKYIFDLEDRVEILEAEPVCPDDSYCVDALLETSFSSPTDGCSATTMSYKVIINGAFNSFVLDFGDGQSTTSSQVGTHTYAAGSTIDPVVTISSDTCTVVQTPTTRTEVKKVPDVATKQPFTIPVPQVPAFPQISIPDFAPPNPLVELPQIIFPCLDINPISLPNISVTIKPPVISIVPPSFGPIPVVRTSISFGPIPSASVTFGPAPKIGPASFFFGPAPKIGPASFSFGQAPKIGPASFSFGPAPNVRPGSYFFGSAPKIGPASFSFGPAPKVIPATVTFGPAPILKGVSSTFGPAPILKGVSSTFGPAPEVKAVSFTFGVAPEVKSASFTFGHAPILKGVSSTFGPAPEVKAVSFTFGVAPEVKSASFSFGHAPEVKSASFSFGHAPEIKSASFSFGHAPEVKSASFSFGHAPEVKSASFTFGHAPDLSSISFQWGNPPAISIAWGSVPTLSCVVTVECGGANGPASFVRGQRFDDNFVDDFNTEDFDIEINDLGIPSEIKVVVPKFPDLILKHDIPEFINIKSDVPSKIIIYQADVLPKEIKIINESVIPNSIKIESLDIPSSIRIDSSSVPDFISLIAVDIPSVIRLDGSEIPDTIKVVGIPDSIEVKMPSEIVARLEVPEGLEIPLVYKGGPVPIQFDNSSLASGDDQVCFALVPCKK